MKRLQRWWRHLARAREEPAGQGLSDHLGSVGRVDGHRAHGSVGEGLDPRPSGRKEEEVSAQVRSRRAHRYIETVRGVGYRFRVRPKETV